MSLTGTLEPGTHTFELRNAGDVWMSVTVTVPNDEWAGRLGWILGTDGFVDSRTGSSIQFWDAPAVVYGHPCQWAGTEIDVEPTVESVAGALAAQPLATRQRHVTSPSATTAGWNSN